MSAKLAYRLAIISLISPVILIVLFILWHIHLHQWATQSIKAQEAAMIARQNEVRSQHNP